ncbi:hypothetical protein DER44DRAFT_438364 [Fusarium oxysporum]|nr:hypothetical protein DER44DRAFT_438364 [Fusarium oxysporum]
MSSSKTLPEIFGGDVEVTLVAPSPDVAGAQLEDWIKEARTNPHVSFFLHIAIILTGLFHQPLHPQRKPFWHPDAWTGTMHCVWQLPIDSRNDIFYRFSQLLQVIPEPIVAPRMITTRPALDIDQVFLLVGADQLNGCLFSGASCHELVYRFRYLLSSHTTIGSLRFDRRVECFITIPTKVLSQVDLVMASGIRYLAIRVQPSASRSARGMISNTGSFGPQMAPPSSRILIVTWKSSSN